MTTRLADVAVVILAGGAGTRFWPLSTEKRPKQFLKLVGERTLLQQAYDRVAALVPAERVLVLTAHRFAAEVRLQLPDIPAQNVIGEPCRRDTAAAVCLAALLCRDHLAVKVMTLLTADHRIEPVSEFQKVLVSAIQGARLHPSALYTIGIRPGYAATSYGYLQLGQRVEAEGSVPHYVLEQFREKPDLRVAQAYVDSGGFRWNSGMFIWTVGAILGELERHLPNHLQKLEQAMVAHGTPGFEQALAEAFTPLASTSIDYAVMERARQVHCVDAEFEWDDLGGWLAMERFLERDAAGNAVRGHLHTRDAAGNIVFCEDEGEHVALVGVRDMVVIRAGNKTLVMPRDRAEELKQLVKTLDEDLR
jgi:mannose-1-phosphate guanylyltransferase